MYSGAFYFVGFNKDCPGIWPNCRMPQSATSHVAAGRAHSVLVSQARGQEPGPGEQNKRGGPRGERSREQSDRHPEILLTWSIWRLKWPHRLIWLPCNFWRRKTKPHICMSYHLPKRKTKTKFSGWENAQGRVTRRCQGYEVAGAGQSDQNPSLSLDHSVESQRRARGHMARIEEKVCPQRAKPASLCKM